MEPLRFKRISGLSIYNDYTIITFPIIKFSLSSFSREIRWFNLCWGYLLFFLAIGSCLLSCSNGLFFLFISNFHSTLISVYVFAVDSFVFTLEIFYLIQLQS